MDKNKMDKNKMEGFYVGIIYVLVISIIMIVFELLMFVVIISPQEKTLIIEKLRDANTSLKQTATSSLETIDPNQNQLLLTSIFSIGASPTNSQYINVSIIRQDDFNNTINDNAIGLMVLLIILFVFFIIACRVQISDTKKIWGIVVLAVLTTLILMGFQLAMYHYGGGFQNKKPYEYTSNDEIIHSIMTYLKEKVGSIDPTVTVPSTFVPTVPSTN